MSYTLRGRVESRLAALLVPFLVACALALAVGEWWPLELAGIMTGVGLALDVLVYDRALDYQPGWLALPLGAAELGLTMVLVLGLGVEAPLAPALWFFAGSWLLAQVLAHAALPVAHLTYAEDGGELGRAGVPLAAAAPLALAAALGVGWAAQPPTVRLDGGVHQGPLLLDRAQKLVGEAGATVRGGIVITADDVTVRGVTVVGGEHGIEVDGAEDVVLEDVTVLDSTMDGIHARRASVTVRDCRIARLRGEFTQAIDISFAFDLEPSLVERCHVIGGREGIVSHFSRVDVRDNHVEGTTLRAIAMTEMSMGMVERNEVIDALGVGIFCNDYSMCTIEENTIVGTRADRATDDPTRQGYAIQAHFEAVATLEDNVYADGPGRIGVFGGAELAR
jgi:hypothetical protein